MHLKNITHHMNRCA